MVDRKVQNISCHRIAALRDGFALMFVACIVTARRDTKVIRKAVGILETLDIADPRKQGDRSHRTDTGNGLETKNVGHFFFGRFRSFNEFGFGCEDLFVKLFPRLNVGVDFEAINDGQRNCFDPKAKLFRSVIFGRCILCHVVFVENTFDLVDDFRTLSDQELSEVGELPDLCIFGFGGNDTSDVVGSLSAAKSKAVVPKKGAEGIGIAFVGLVQGVFFGLKDDDLGALVLLEFFEQPIVEAADLDDSHVASVFASFFDEGCEEVGDGCVLGADLAFLDDISLFVSDADGQLFFVLVDSEIEHGYSFEVRG